MILPTEAAPLLAALAPAFSQPTFARFVALLAAAILTTGCRTVANLVRTRGPLAQGHRTDYQRVLSRSPWSGLRLGCTLTAFLLDHLLPAGPVLLVGDDTVDGHKDGGGTRQVRAVTATGHWYKSGQVLVPIRRVFVRDQSGTHRDEYFYSTDLALAPAVVIGYYTGRWNIETTFQEMRSCLGLESTRGWCQKTVSRAAPCLFGLYTVVALLYQALPEAKHRGGAEWPGKAVVTFSDALTAVRRWLWSEWVFPQAEGGAAVEKLPPSLREVIFAALAPPG